jgi:hypothetical protein
MHRRGLVALGGMLSVAGLAGVASLAGCDRGTAPRGDGAAASPGSIPTALPTPSLPPSSAPLATGLRVDGAALLVWFGGPGATTGMDSVWYDPGTGGVVTGPPAMAAWTAARPDGGFQRVVAAAGRDGRIVVYGWLIGPAVRVWLEWRGARLTGTLLPWPADPGRQAFWLRAGDWVPAGSATASPGPSPGPAAASSGRASLFAADAGGKTLFELSLSAES